MPLPYPAITKIPNTEPAAIPDLWNVTYNEIDANFSSVAARLDAVEADMAVTLLDLGVTVTAAKINFLSGVTSDVQAQINGKLNAPGGTTAQYIRGDGSAAAFPTTWAWANISGKPTTFAGLGVTLAASDVPTLNQNTTGSAATLTTARTLTIGASGKTFNGSASVTWTLAEIGAAPVSHQHAIADVIGLQEALDSTTSSAHNHSLDTLSNVSITNNSVGELLRWGGTSWANATLAECGIASVSHSHAVGDISGLQAALDGKLATTGTAAAATKLATARTLTLGATARSFDGTANLSWTLADLGAAAVTHTHVINDVSGLQSALDGKAGSAHSHTLDSLSNVTITNNSTGELLRWAGTSWANATLAECGIAAASHSHVVGDISGLQGALDGKLSTGGTAAAATKLATARTFTIGSTARSFDGTANLSWTVAEIGAAGLGANSFSGTQTAPGFAVSSLRELKDGIVPLEVGDGLIDLFEPKSFHYKTDPHRTVAGLIHDEVVKVFPLACTEHGIDYGQLVPLLIVEMQRMRARVASLEAKAA